MIHYVCAAPRWTRALLGGVLLVLLSGCASIAGRFGDGLAEGIRRHDDPQTVERGLPAYLLLLDGLLVDRPHSAGLLRPAAELYAVYAGSFVDEPARARRLSQRSMDYARRLVAEELPALHAALDGPVQDFIDLSAGVDERDVASLQALAASWTTLIQTHSDDWSAIAALPKAQALIERVVRLDEDYQNGMPWVYLGVLHSLRPAAVGGQPELGRAAFERAIELSQGRNLMAKTLYAEYYARLVFDRELHDRLVNDVLNAEAVAEDFTLSNVLAQQRAQQLQGTADEYF